MLLKTRREFTLCFFLFAPLGMAGYAAEVISSSSTADVNVANEEAPPAAHENGSNAHAGIEDTPRGGQAGPAAAGGGLSSAERLSRLLVDGRKAYRDGNYGAASNYFRQALEVDGDNQEARRYIGQIDKRGDGALFSVEAGAGIVPTKRRPAEPLPVTAEPEKPVVNGSGREELKPKTQVISLNASEALGAASTVRFSQAISSEVSFDAPVVASLKTSPANPQANTSANAKPNVEKAVVSSGAVVAKSAAKAVGAIADASSRLVKSAASTAVKSATNKDQKSAAVSAEKSPRKSEQNRNRPVTAQELASAPSAGEAFAKDILPGLDGDAPSDQIASVAKPQSAREILSQPVIPQVAAEPQETKAEKKDVAPADQKVEERSAPNRNQGSSDKAPAASGLPSGGGRDVAGAKKSTDSAPAKDADSKLDSKIVNPGSGEKSAAPKSETKAASEIGEKPANKPSDEKAIAGSEEKLKADTKEVSTKAPAAEKEKKTASAKPEPKKKSAAPSEKTAGAALDLDKAVAAEKKTDGSKDAADSAALKQKSASESKAAAETNAGIKLYNSGKYSEALAKFKSALSADKDNSEADQYRVRAEKKLASNRDSKPVGSKSPKTAEASSLGIKAGDDKNPPLLDLEKIKPENEKRKKEVAQAPPVATPTPAAAPESDTPPQVLRPLSEALAPLPPAGDPTPVATPAPTAAPSVDPIVEADKLLRQAQRELQEGKRDAALETAKRAAALDANNVEAKALVSDLSATSAAIPAPSVQPLDAAPSAASVAAPPPPPAGIAGSVDALITEGKNKYQAGNLREALTSFKAALELQPDNPIARTYVTKIEQERDAAPVLPGEPLPAGPDDKGAGGGTRISAQMQAQDAEQAFQQGLVAYQAGRLDVAVQHWNYALTLSPNHPRAIQYLEQTRAEYDAWVQQHQYNALELQKEVVATEKLDTGVTYDTAGQKTIVEFLSAMSLITDISFYVADGVDPEIKVTAKFEDQPLHDALDIVLLPIGLKWTRTADVVTVTPDLRNKFFNLTPEQVGRLKTLLENKTLQRYLYGPEGVPPMRNVEITLDDRENLLIVTDSQENINKIEAFLKDMQLAAPQGLVYRNWKIRPEEGAKIKSLVEAIVRVQSDAPYDLERKVVVDGDDLIVKDTAENVAKIEQLLLDKNFLRKLETQQLSVATYNLTPKEPIRENQEQMRDLAQSIVTVVKTILYSQSTESAAAAEGRRYWFDPNTLQMTITDYPENLRIVGDYIRSLPMLGGDKQRSEIIFLKHQTASTMEDLLNRVLGLSATAVGGTTAGGNSVTKTLRVEGELVFRDLRLRVTRIEEGDVNDDNDDSVTMVVRTGTTSEDRTIQEFRSDFIDEYEINVIEVRPSNSPGEGSARLEVTYVPGGQAGLAGGGAGAFPPAVTPVGVGGAPLPGAFPVVPGVAAVPVVPADTTLQIESIENMNALLIRYEDPGDLAEVKSWLEQLDIPVLQVNIETKLVEVNETRVKQFLPEFNVLNIGQGGIDFGNNFNTASGLVTPSIFNGFQDPAYPLANNAQNASLLNPISVFNIVTGGDTPINFTLRMLESEGVLNLVNGPTVTVENGETANFEIEKTFGTRGVTQNQNQGQQQTFQATGGPTIPHVQLSVSPQITQIGEIRLDIQDLELNDQGNPLGDETFLDFPAEGQQFAEPVVITRRRGLELYDTRRRSLQTVARVRNHGTIILGGWTGEHSLTNDAGIPILRNIPYIGKLLFGQTSDRIEKTTLLIFLTCHLVEP